MATSKRRNRTREQKQQADDARSDGNVAHSSGLIVRHADLTRARPFRWAWRGRVLLSYINLLVGEEGVGKGNLVAWIAAQLTLGELDGDLKGQPRKVMIVGDEDDFDHVWVPRLHVAGANLDNVVHLVSGPTGDIDVTSDAEAMRQLIADEGVVLAYFDQLLDNLGMTDSWKDKDVRMALAPLRHVARQTNVAALATLHPNKRKGSFRERVSGTPAFNALSRSSLLVATHPLDPDRVAVVRPKGNYSMEPPAFEFHIQQIMLTPPREGAEPIVTSKIVDTRESLLTKDELLAPPPARLQEDSKAGQARKQLAEMFADGQERPASEVIDQLTAQGITERTVTRAATEIGLKRRQEGFPAKWYWKRP